MPQKIAIIQYLTDGRLLTSPNPRVRIEFASFGPYLRSFPVIASFTHWVKSQYRAKARRYWAKPHFSPPYPWIQGPALLGHHYHQHYL
jgi:hypothetical protein